MSLNLCRLTEDVLPLYVDDLLSPEIRGAVEEHARSCSACASLLAGGGTAAPPSAPTPEPPAFQDSANRLAARLRRILLTALAGLLVLLMAVSVTSYQAGQRGPVTGRQPLRVRSAADFAARAVPGWERAHESGLLIRLGATYPIPHTPASVTLEDAWFGPDTIYILYTVKAPEGRHMMTTRAHMGGDVANFPKTHSMGAFSDEGYHQVLVFSSLPAEQRGEYLTLEMFNWAEVSPRTAWESLGQAFQVGERVTVKLPYRPDYVKDAMQGFPLHRQETWLGRTLALEKLEIGMHAARLHGWIELLPGETDPTLGVTVRFGKTERTVKRYEADPTEKPNRYQFSITTDPPDTWPVRPAVKFWGLGFHRREPLAVDLAWQKYRGQAEAKPLPEDARSVAFYDSTLVLDRYYQNAREFSFRVVHPDKPKPYVALDHSQRVEYVGPNGHRITNLGGGGGNWEGQTVSWSHHFSEEDAEKLENAAAITLLMTKPKASMHLDETWELHW